MPYKRSFGAGASISSGSNTAADYRFGGDKKQGLSGQSITKPGPTLSVNHKSAQRSVMFYNNGFRTCTNPNAGGIGRKLNGRSSYNFGGGGSCRRRLTGHVDRSPLFVGMFSYGHRV